MPSAFLRRKRQPIANRSRKSTETATGAKVAPTSGALTVTEGGIVVPYVPESP
jgi:hypothetical protein